MNSLAGKERRVLAGVTAPERVHTDFLKPLQPGKSLKSQLFLEEERLFFWELALLINQGLPGVCASSMQLGRATPTFGDWKGEKRSTLRRVSPQSPKGRLKAEANRGDGIMGREASAVTHPASGYIPLMALYISNPFLSEIFGDLEFPWKANTIPDFCDHNCNFSGNYIFHVSYMLVTIAMS